MACLKKRKISHSNGRFWNKFAALKGDRVHTRFFSDNICLLLYQPLQTIIWVLSGHIRLAIEKTQLAL